MSRQKRVIPGRYKWDPEDPRCTSCHVDLRLRDGREWNDIPQANVCQDCAVAFVEQFFRDREREELP